MNKTRRQLMLCSIGTIVGGLFARQGFATAEDVESAIAAFAGDAAPEAGKVSITAPEIAENGNTVPISISVDSPMSEDDYVESVILFADGNPNPDVATFHFTPANGVAKASTRMRLAKTQNVIAVAKMSNGSFYTDTRSIKVTIGGCGG